MTTILLQRVRPVRRAGFFLLGPSTRICTWRPTNAWCWRAPDSFTASSNRWFRSSFTAWFTWSGMIRRRGVAPLGILEDKRLVEADFPRQR